MGFLFRQRILTSTGRMAVGMVILSMALVLSWWVW